ncbi:unnamed protein product [Paramecium sonneborni]|uniref:t-SNARE coiled-coil homology domain-containing protein n=1 Tax=Paramecium sonneborni TaxID=65129 RepID=A0A8S1PFW2_9CILI|nr:unnamed protein product [Paramecium sonneborni]
MSSQDLEFVQENLQTLIKTVQELQNLLQGKENQDQIQINKQKCSKLIDALTIKFKQGKFNKSENMTIQMLKKEFTKQQNTFIEITKSIRNPKQINSNDGKEVEMQNAKKLNGKSTYVYDEETNYEEEDSGEKGPNLDQLSEMEVHPDIQHKAMLIQEQQEEIDQIQKDALEVLKIQTEVAQVVVDQGKMLDVAENNINKSNTNVKEAVVELEGAKVEHKKYMKKLAGAVCIILIVVAVIVVCVKLI